MQSYERLFAFYGPQGWWPGETPFEVVVGAILTQNTAWKGAEKALAALRQEGVLTPRKMDLLPLPRLASLIRPSGYYNVKARRLKSFLRFLRESYGLSMRRLAATPLQRARKELLTVDGIGPETADSILLYAAGRPAFVVDAYTRRILSRHHLVAAGIPYHALQEFIVARIPRDAGLYNEFHALLVSLGKQFCRPRAPRCDACPLDAPEAMRR
jgi:endonuclease-3 related protein